MKEDIMIKTEEIKLLQEISDEIFYKGKYNFLSGEYYEMILKCHSIEYFLDRAQECLLQKGEKEEENDIDTLKYMFTKLNNVNDIL